MQEYAIEQRGSQRLFRLNFGSVTETIANIRTGKMICLDNDRQFQYQSTSNGGTFFEGWSIKRIEKSLQSPSTSMLEDINKYVEDLREHVELPVARRRKIVRGLDDGSEIDVDRWFRREPTMFDDIRITHGTAKTCRLAVNMSVNCSQDRSHTYQRAAAVIAIAELLTEAGVNVSIDALDIMYGGCLAREGLSSDLSAGVGITTLQVKDISEPLDIPRLALAIGEIGVHRRLLYSCQVQAAWKRVESGLAYPITSNQLINDQYDIAIPGFQNRSDILAFVKTQFLKFTQKDTQSC